MDLSIILPIYNEVDNIEPVLAEIEEVAGAMNIDYEVIAVDDGSKDGSRDLLQKLVTNKEYLKLVFFRRNFGQSAAFDAGFRNAQGRYVVTMDADLQNDPHDIPAMLKLLEEGNDFVSGWRKKRMDGLFLRLIPSLIANWFIRKATGTTMHDMGCSLKAYRREIANEIRLYGETHRFVAVFAEETGARSVEMRVNHRPRIAGKSKVGLNRIIKVILDLVTVKFLQTYKTKPIYLFGGVGLLCVFFAALIMGFVAYQKLILGIWVHKNPLFLLSIISAIIGVQFFGMGLISELIIRTYFESQKKTAYSIVKRMGFQRRGEKAS